MKGQDSIGILKMKFIFSGSVASVDFQKLLTAKFAKNGREGRKEKPGSGKVLQARPDANLSRATGC
jgi:hypothetical protein